VKEQRMAGPVLIVLAGFMGAAGVALAAAAAHGAAGAGLEAAAFMLLAHAGAAVALAAALDRGVLWRPLGLAAAFGLVLGASLFSADIACRSFAGARLFPMAAPTGGTLMILAWIAVALAAGLRLVRDGGQGPIRKSGDSLSGVGHATRPDPRDR
jgi:uncharacterized membrane protein YgdD (TMEM256/DUF423 family)